MNTIEDDQNLTLVSISFRFCQRALIHNPSHAVCKGEKPSDVEQRLLVFTRDRDSFYGLPCRDHWRGWWTKHEKSLRVFQYYRGCTSTLQNTGPWNIALQKAFSPPYPRWSCLWISFDWHGLFYDVVYQATSFTRPLSTRYFSVFWNKAGFLSLLLNRAEYKVTKTLTIRCANDGWSL